MSIQKKSLISALKTAKKANVASTDIDVKGTTVASMKQSLKAAPRQTLKAAPRQTLKAAPKNIA